MRKLSISVYPPRIRILRTSRKYRKKTSNSPGLDGHTFLQKSEAVLFKTSWIEGSSFAPASARGGEENDVAGPSPGRNLLFILKRRPMTLNIYIIRTSKMGFFYTYWNMVGHPFQKLIMTSCTWAFLPRIIVYNHYVLAFILYTTIYIAYIRVFNTRICAKSNARLYALLKTRIYAYLSKPTYTRVKMCIYAGFRNQTWYKIARKVPLTE